MIGAFKPKEVLHLATTFQENPCRGDGYVVTNEDLAQWRNLLGDMKFERGASIVSGGEVLMFMLLPRCESVLGFDHGMRALLATSYKAALLHTSSTVEEFRNCFKPENAQKAFESVKKYIPEDILKSEPSHYGLHSSSPAYFDQLARVTKEEIEAAKGRLDRVTLAHCDVMDLLKNHEPFDIIYTSNLCDHTNRHNKRWTLDDLAPLVKVGGYMIDTNSQTQPSSNWQNVRQLATIGWMHSLRQRIK